MQRVVLKMVPIDQEDQLEALEREAETLIHLQTFAAGFRELAKTGIGIAHIQPVDRGPDGHLVYSAIEKVHGLRHGSDVERAFIAMDDIRGMSLWSFVEATPERSLSIQHTALIGLRLARLMECLHHDAKILHNEIKPQNLIIGPGASPFRITLVDFGISLTLDEYREVEPGQHGMAYWGVEEYMSPEKRLARKGTPPASFDWRSDLWSLAAVMHYMLGYTPGVTSGAWGKEGVAGSIPEPLSSFLKRALSENPRDRHWNWQQVRQELEECVRTFQNPSGRTSAESPLLAAIVRSALDLINTARARS